MPVLSSQSLDLAFHEWRNCFPPIRGYSPQKTPKSSFSIARRQTDCPSKIAKIADRCLSFKVKKKTCEKDERTRKASSTITLTLALYMQSTCHACYPVLVVLQTLIFTLTLCNQMYQGGLPQLRPRPILTYIN